MIFLLNFCMVLCSCIHAAKVGHDDDLIDRLNEIEILASKVVHKKEIQKNPTSVSNTSTPEVHNLFGGGIQTVIQTKNNGNILNSGDLLRHKSFIQQIITTKIEAFGQTWTYSDLCTKSDLPSDSTSPLLSSMLSKLIPCAVATPLDCFWDGGVIAGPYPPLKIESGIALFVPSLEAGEATWGNLNPSRVMEDISIFFDVTNLRQWFSDAGIGQGYMDRPCVDPMDPKCPKSAPNQFDICYAVQVFLEWNKKQSDKSGIDLNDYRPVNSPFLPVIIEEQLESAELSEQIEGSGQMQNETVVETEYEEYGGADNVNDYYGGFGNAGQKQNPEYEKFNDCRVYGYSVRNALLAHPELMLQLLPIDKRPIQLDFAQVLHNGCKGVASATVKYPRDMLMSGVRLNDNGTLASASSLRTTLLFASKQQLHHRFKDGKEGNAPSNFNNSEWSEEQAEAVLQKWRAKLEFVSNLDIGDGNKFLSFYYPYELDRALKNFFAT